ERLADRLLRRLRPARLRLDDPEPRRDAAGSDAWPLPARHLGPRRNVAPRLSPSRGPACANVTRGAKRDDQVSWPGRRRAGAERATRRAGPVSTAQRAAAG